MVRSPVGPSPCALKIGSDLYGFQTEMNTMRDLSGFVSIYLADDWQVGTACYPFYTMPFVDGAPMDRYARSVGTRELLECGEKLLQLLQLLHLHGWAFGDLKSGNVLASAGGKPQLVDFGGSAPFGSSIKQYSELYDRGYWKAGGRTAEATYDLFSFAVLMIESAGGERLLKETANRAEARNERGLLAVAGSCAALRPVSACISKMIRGEYAGSDEALAEWRLALSGYTGSAPGTADPRWLRLWLSGSAAAFAASLCWMVLK